MAGALGRFLAFEGCDASGKTTQGRLLAERIGALFTREPGDTPLGVRIRSLLLDHSAEGASMAARTEALLYAADRAQHVAEVIRPALHAGRAVVCDRYIASSIAYQGVGRGLGAAEVRRVSEWATDGLWPDLTVLLRVPVEVVMSRLAASRSPDRLEAEGAEFLGRVIAAFDELAGAEPDRWVVVDGAGPIEEVAESVWTAVTSFADRWHDG